MRNQSKHGIISETELSNPHRTIPTIEEFVAMVKEMEQAFADNDEQDSMQPED